MHAPRVKWNQIENDSYNCSPQIAWLILSPLTALDHYSVRHMAYSTKSSWLKAFKPHPSVANWQTLLSSRSKCILWFLYNLVWHTSLGRSGQWSTIYKKVVCKSRCHAWFEAPEDNSAPLPNKKTGRKLRSYNCHSSVALCCGNPERLGKICAIINLRV